MVMEKSWNMKNVMEFCYQSWNFTNVVPEFATTKKTSIDVESPHFPT